jgi:anti-anti-sigma factor
MVIHRKHETVFAYPEGEISFLNMEEIKREILRHILDSDRHLVLNLQKVDFMDSTGMGMLLVFLKMMRNRGGDMVVEYPQLGVQKLLEMTRLDKMMKVIKTDEPATGAWEKFNTQGIYTH